MTFKKDNIMKNFVVSNGKVLTTIIVDGIQVINPSVDLFVSTGWEEYVEPQKLEVEQILPTIEELVERKIRERYSINKEFEINRKRETEPNQFNEYYDYVESCITWAYEQPHREEEIV